MSGWCNLHQRPLVFKRIMGDWWLVCPVCDMCGLYEASVAENAAGYIATYGENTYDVREGSGIVGDRETVLAPQQGWM